MGIIFLCAIGNEPMDWCHISSANLYSGVAFKKTFSYAGFEMQQKQYKDPLIALLNVELELKAEKENAEVRVTNVKDYQSVVDAEWDILYEKLEACYKSGAKVISDASNLTPLSYFLKGRIVKTANRRRGNSILCRP